jgi:hypothetical protein
MYDRRERKKEKSETDRQTQSPHYAIILCISFKKLILMKNIYLIK